MTERYHASDGSLWNIGYDPPSIPTRVHDWTWVHDDYDGAPDAHDDRHGTAPTRDAAIAAVEEWIEENSEETSTVSMKPEPLSDAESAQLDVILALLNDDPQHKITVTARILCAFVESQTIALRAEVERQAAIASRFNAMRHDLEYANIALRADVERLTKGEKP